MKKLILLPLFLLVFSCTVQKRHYQKGYFVSWKKHSSVKDLSKEKAGLASNSTKAMKEVSPIFVEETKTEISSDVSNSIRFIPEKKKSVLSASEDSCDVMVYRDGSETKIKILEVSGTTVKYKKCSMPDGPVYITEKSKIFMIKYSNGTNEVFKAEPAPTYEQQSQTSTPQYRYVRKKTALATTGLVFAILGFYPLAIIGGLIAIITSTIQLHLISADPENYGAERKARVAFVMGIVSVILWVAVIGLIILAG